MPSEPNNPPTYLPLHDLHVHTVHCGHARPDATVANLVARAEELGLEWLGFSEHVVFAEEAPQVGMVRRDVEGLDHAKLRVKLLVGSEMDPDPIRLDGSWVADPGPLDFVVLSPHRLPGLGIGHFQLRRMTLSDRERRRVGEAWLDWYETCVERGGFQILGHPLREPINLRLITLLEDRTLDRVLHILLRAASRSIAFEINNGWAAGVREYGQFAAYAALMRELKAHGMRFCCGSDSHGVAYLGGREGIRTLAAAAGLGPGDWLDPAELVPDRA